MKFRYGDGYVQEVRGSEEMDCRSEGEADEW